MVDNAVTTETETETEKEIECGFSGERVIILKKLAQASRLSYYKKKLIIIILWVM